LRFLEYLASETYNRQVNRCFDALAPTMKYCSKPYALSDGKPDMPGLPGANDQQWVDLMQYAHGGDYSPFITPYHTDNYLTNNMDLWDNGKMTTKEALDKTAQQINAEIQHNLALDPKLKKRYDALIAKEQEAGR
jgi:hypothetical protein